MNYLIGPKGEEIHAPGISHSGEAQRIMKERGQDMDPSMALEQLMREGWIRISGNMFELFPTTGWKERMKAFIAKFAEFYRNEPYIELDNRSKGFSRQVPISSFLKEEYNPESEAAQRAEEMMRWRRQF